MLTEVESIMILENSGAKHGAGAGRPQSGLGRTNWGSGPGQIISPR